MATTAKRRPISSAVKSVNEVFNSQTNKAKFCMPLGLNSAREIEVGIQKDQAQKSELNKKKK